MAGTLEIPVVGSSNASQEPKIKANFETLNNKLNSENDWEDSALASPNNSAYRTLLFAQSMYSFDAAAGTYFLCNQSSGLNPLTSGSAIGNTNRLSPHYLYFDDADYSVANKTQKLRIRAQIACNATKAAIKFTFGMYPITVAGGTDELTITLGTVVSGSTVEINEPAASTVTSGTGSDFTIPSDGAFMLGVVTSGTLTNNSITLLSAHLQTRSV